MAERDLTARIRVEQEGDVEALEGIVDDLRQLGPAASTSSGQADTALSKLGTLLADLRSGIREVSSSSRESFSAFSSAVASARGTLDELKGVVAGLGDDELPEVRDELARLEDSFDQVFSKGAEKALELGEGLDETAKKAREVGDGARDGVGGVNDLGDALQSKFPAGAKAIGGAVAAVETFKISFQETREVVGFFREQFGIDIDKIVSDALRLQEAVELFVKVGNTLRENSELLQNQQRIFDNLKLDGFTANVEENAELLDAHFRKIGGAVSDAQSLLDRLNLNPQKLLDQAAKLSAEFKSALDLNPDIDLSVLSDRLLGEVERIVAGLKATGTQVPEELARIVEQLKAAAVDGTEEMGAQVTSGLAKVTTGLAAEVEKMRAELEPLTSGNIFAQDEEALDDLRARLQELVDAHRAAGEKIDPLIADTASKLGLLVGDYERAAGGALVFSGANETLEGTSLKIVKVVNEQGEETKKVVQVSNAAAGALRDYEKAQAGAGTAAETAGSKQGAAAEGIGRGKEALTQQAAAAGSAATGLDNAASAAERAATAGQNLFHSLKGSGDSVQELASSFESVITTLSTLADTPVKLDTSQASAALDELKAKAREVLELLAQVEAGGSGAGAGSTAPPPAETA